MYKNIYFEDETQNEHTIQIIESINNLREQQFHRRKDNHSEKLKKNFFQEHKQDVQQYDFNGSNAIILDQAKIKSYTMNQFRDFQIFNQQKTSPKLIYFQENDEVNNQQEKKIQNYNQQQQMKKIRNECKQIKQDLKRKRMKRNRNRVQTQIFQVKKPQRQLKTQQKQSLVYEQFDLEKELNKQKSKIKNQYFNNNLRISVTMKIPRNTTVRFFIKKITKGLLRHTEIDLFQQSTKKLIMKAKKQITLEVKYKIYIAQESQYFGKVESNVLRNNFDISIRQKLNTGTFNNIRCNVIYQDDKKSEKIPRKINVYIPNPQFSEIHEKNKSLIKKHTQRPQTVIKLVNKKPEWDVITKSFKLNFYGRVAISSVKNFILTKQNENSPILIFGKKQDNTFNLDVRYPLNVFQAFSIILTNFDFKSNLI